MNKKVSVGVLVSVAAMVMALTFTITMVFSIGLFDNKMSSTKGREAMYSKIAEVDNYVRASYVGDIDDSRMMDSVLRGYVAGMDDKYARYYSVQEWKDIQNSFNGTVTGVGIAGKADTSGYIRVTKVYDSSPAGEAGLAVDDLIISIDGKDVLELGAATAMKQIQGDPGSKVKIGYMRGNAENSIEVVRRSVTVPTVEYQKVDDLGYIRIYEFNNNTLSQFDYAINQLEAQDVKGYVFDVRDNGGGLTEVAADMLDMLVPKGTIASAQYRDGKVEKLYTSDKKQLAKPMAVLTNENTASSAELFAAVLRDFEKAKLVGTATYGKGVMQEYKQLSDGSGVDVTVAYLLPPSGEIFDEIGLKPDYEVALTQQQQQQSYQLTTKTDPQIKKAIEVVKAELDPQSSSNGGAAGQESAEQVQQEQEQPAA